MSDLKGEPRSHPSFFYMTTKKLSEFSTDQQKAAKDFLSHPFNEENAPDKISDKDAANVGKEEDGYKPRGVEMVDDTVDGKTDKWVVSM